MKQVLYDYDIFPMVFPVGRQTDFTIRPLGIHCAFNGNITVKIRRIDGGDPAFEFNAWNSKEIECTKDDRGYVHFSYTADAETELMLDMMSDGRYINRLFLYALGEDLACRYPLRGDLHMHTCRSDGREDGAVVCANYRALGYDFISITDHFRYYPSIETIGRYKGAEIPLNILPGEEVHLPDTDVHIVHVGGKYSVNGLLPCLRNYIETNGSIDGRRMDESIEPPPIISDEEYKAQIDEVEKSLTDCPQNVEKRSYAVCKWAFDRIREAEGLSIFAHPYWITSAWQVAEPLTRYTLQRREFDAFEVLGGESYYEQNGFQTALYYDEYRHGRVHPIVGSTDSHGSTEHNRNFDICSTIVFAHENERTSIIDAVREGYSLAVDTISREYRLVGDFRLQKYASFLMENYFPIHDRQARLDGELMRQYYVGDLSAEEMTHFTEKSRALLEKYIKIG